MTISYINNLDSGLSVRGKLNSVIDNVNYIPTLSGSLQDQIDEVASDLSTTSGTIQDEINSLESDLATISGSLQDQIDVVSLDLSTISGSLQSEIDDKQDKATSFDEDDFATFDANGNATKAVKSIECYYLDELTASGTVYSNSSSGLLADDVQAAIDEIVSDLSTTSGTLQSEIDAIEVSLSTTSGTLQDEINSIESDIATISGSNSQDVSLSTDSGLELNGQVLNVGTPSDVTGSSTNSVTGSAHSHQFRPLNNEYVKAVDAAGTGTLDLIKGNASDHIEFGEPVSIGLSSFAPDSGEVVYLNMPVTSASVSGTKMSYVFQIGGEDILKVYGESDGSNGVENLRAEFYKASLLKGTTGGFYTAYSEATSGALTGASGTITLNIPDNSWIKGVQLRVDTAITGPDDWEAFFGGGNEADIADSISTAKNTKVNSLSGGLTTGLTQLYITTSGSNFTGGVVRAVAYYDTFLTMGDS